jgi:hypothetical protein
VFSPTRKTKSKDEIVPIGLLYIIFTPTTPGVSGGAPLFDITLSADAFAKYGAGGDYRLAYRDGTQKKAAYVMDADRPIAAPSPTPSPSASATAAPAAAKPVRAPGAITVTAAPTIAPVHIVFSGLPIPPIKVGASLSYVLYVVPTPKPTVAPTAAPSTVASPAAPTASAPSTPAAPTASAPVVSAPGSVAPAPATTTKP